MAFFSYLGFFYRFTITRDIPWVNMLLFVIAIALLVMGVQRAPDSNRHPVSLSQVLSTTPRGALLIFYRGYW
jgi:hypothetical protein